MKKVALIVVALSFVNTTAYCFLSDCCGVPVGNISMEAWYQLVSKHNQELREFKHEPNLFKGLFLGKIRADGIIERSGKSQNVSNMEYYHFQFKGCLQGDERILNIFTPVTRYGETSYNRNGRIEETDSESRDGKPAFLYVGVLRDFLKKEGIKDYFREAHHIPLTTWDEYPVLLETMAPIWYPAYLGGNDIHLGYPFELNGRFYAVSPVKLKLKWIVRSPISKIIRPLMGYGSMIVTVPLDIITTPVQIALWAKAMAH